jgi:hypothetical protein
MRTLTAAVLFLSTFTAPASANLTSASMTDQRRSGLLAARSDAHTP